MLKVAGRCDDCDGVECESCGGGVEEPIVVALENTFEKLQEVAHAKRRTEMSKYYNAKGEVGILLSTGFGAGWSIWNDNKAVDLVFDKGLVGLAIRKASNPLECLVGLRSNKFGEATVYSPESLTGTSYITSAACMTVWAETTGWANRFKNRVAANPENADNIIVLSCQVTDLAILNDINTIEKMMMEFPGKTFFIGGCLAQRFDIGLPEGVKRLDHMRADYEPVTDRTLVNYEKPFWVSEFKESDNEFEEGNLFRGMYPLRVGSGCHGKCKYCTIKITRGSAYDLEPEGLESEFAENDDIVLIADSVTSKQIIKYSGLALKYSKTLSFRNIEPQNVVAAKDTIITLAAAGLLKVLHTPVQAISEKTLKTMNRSKKQVDKVLQIVRQVKDLGVFTATNIIIDYDGCENDFDEIYSLFDYVSWNPYWNGDFDIEKARERMGFYIKNAGLTEAVI